MKHSAAAKKEVAMKLRFKDGFYITMCPYCGKTIRFEVERNEKKTNFKGNTFDCYCGQMFIITQDYTIRNFNEVMNERCACWPKDGKGTATTEISL